MFDDLRNRVKKVNQPPGSPIYIGKNTEKKPTAITIVNYNSDHATIKTGTDLETCFPDHVFGVTWIHFEGLQNVEQVKALAERYSIHPLTVEDILNVDQRPKVEEYDHYSFVTLKALDWNKKTFQFSSQQLSIVFGKNFILTFQESNSEMIATMQTRIQNTSSTRLREQNADYLMYRLVDAVVDAYFVVLEGMGEQIEAVETRIISEPTPQNSKTIYRLKRGMLALRKIIWPLREVLSHLLYEENGLITKFTRIYIRDAYDHTMQAIDTVETFRDMLSGLLDMYLSGLTIRMNEIMKTLTIITTIFIPITAIASIYGMNVRDVPFMKSPWGFDVVAMMMVVSVTFMVLYFRRKKWV